MSEKLAIVTIDGPAGVGKTTISRMVAAHLGYTCLDTGAMYRSFAWMLTRTGHDGEDLKTDPSLLAMLGNVEMVLLPPLPGEENGRVRLGGQVLGPELRTEAISFLASEIASLPELRRVLTLMQQRLGAKGRVVIEGRDTGTVVFPQAAWKFFLDATPEERTTRRLRQLRARGDMATSEAALLESIVARDLADRNRSIAPLVAAADAYTIDTTNLDIRAVVGEMLAHIGSKPL